MIYYISLPMVRFHQPLFEKEGIEMTQEALTQIEFPDNPEPRCPVVLLLDTF